MSFCTNCGHRIETRALFCTNCGLKIISEEIQDNNTESIIPPADLQAPSDPASNLQTPPDPPINLQVPPAMQQSMQPFNPSQYPQNEIPSNTGVISVAAIILACISLVTAFLMLIDEDYFFIYGFIMAIVSFVLGMIVNYRKNKPEFAIYIERKRGLTKAAVILSIITLIANILMLFLPLIILSLIYV